MLALVEPVEGPDGLVTAATLPAPSDRSVEALADRQKHRQTGARLTSGSAESELNGRREAAGAQPWPGGAMSTVGASLAPEVSCTARVAVTVEPSLKLNVTGRVWDGYSGWAR